MLARTPLFAESQDKMRSNSEIIVDLNAVQHNYRAIKKAANGVECAPVLKANAYGLGIEKISLALLDAGARTFFVAFLQEGVRLRKILGRTKCVKIYILEGNTRGSEIELLKYSLSPVINSTDQYLSWKSFSKDHPDTESCAIHIDTGMNRLGFGRETHDDLVELVNEGNVKIDLYISHLTSADIKNSKNNCQQLDVFQCVTNKMPKTRRSISNSSGVFLGDKYNFEMIRTGIGLFTSRTDHKSAFGLKPVVQIHARILQIRKIQKGEIVGYAETFVSQKPMKLGTIAIGYADGYPRSASGSPAGVYYNNRKAPLVGRVSMDTIVVDFSDFDNESPTVNEFVEVFSEDQDIDSLAKYANTISNDLLTSFGGRMERLYV